LAAVLRAKLLLVGKGFGIVFPKFKYYKPVSREVGNTKSTFCDV